jgi:uncharacterized delta-60 repeat protein
MGSLVKSSGEWKNSLPYVKADGEWKVPKSAWTKTSDGWKSWFLQGGLNDSGFYNTDTNSGLNGDVQAIVVQQDGKILVGGNFSFFGETLANGIARFNSDGNFDTDFALNIGSGFTTGSGQTIINDIIVQPDGKIIIVGYFEFFNGLAVGSIVRINPDGSPDDSFIFNTGLGAHANSSLRETRLIMKVRLQTDKKIIVTGAFSRFNETFANSIARLNPDGTTDINFINNTVSNFGPSRPEAEIKSFAIQTDGKIILVGAFEYFNEEVVNNIVRLNANGTTDSPFTIFTGSGTATSQGEEPPTTLFGLDLVEVQPDQKIVITGTAFDFFNNVPVPKAARLNTNGTLDTTASVPEQAIPFLSEARKIIRQPDGKFIIAGLAVSRMGLDGTFENDFVSNLPVSFRSKSNDNYRFASVALQADNKIIVPLGPNSKIGRLNPDGNLDNTFLANFFTGFSEKIEAMDIQKSGKIILASSEGLYLNKTAMNKGIVRLNVNGSIDEVFLQNIQTLETSFEINIASIVVQPDEKILIGGRFSFNGNLHIARLNSDGTMDATFNENIGGGFVRDNMSEPGTWDMDIQTDGKIVIVGLFKNFKEEPAYGLLRLNPDGTRDTSFIQTWTNMEESDRNDIYSIKIQPDNKIIISGTGKVGGTLKFNNSSYLPGVLRFNSDGTVDNDYYLTFQSEKNFLGFPSNIIIQSDGKLICSWRTGPGAPKGIARFNLDGTLDTEFDANIGRGVAFSDDPITSDPRYEIHSMAIQEDEKIIIAGNFPKFNETNSNGIARLNLDGTLDTEFSSNIGEGFNSNSDITSIKIQKNNKIVACGSFQTFDQVNRKYLARIGGDPATA